MNKKLWIFGDSYAMRHEHTGSWPRQIEKYYDVKNWAQGGTGPDYTLEQLNKIISNEDEDPSNVTAIFFLSDLHRQNWEFWEEPFHQSLGVDLVHNKWLNNEESRQQLKKKYRKYKPFVKTWIESQKGCWPIVEHQKNLGMINLLAPAFKKVLVIYCFYKPVLPRIKLSSNLYIASKTMVDVQPLLEDQQSYDPNPNHLHIKDHPKFLETLRSWIDDDVQI